MEKVDDLIEDFEGLEFEEASGLIKEWHKNNILLDDAKKKIVQTIQNKIEIPVIDDNLINEMSLFLDDLDQKLTKFNNEEIPNE